MISYLNILDTGDIVDLEGIRVEEDSLDTMDVHTVPSDVEDNQEVCILDVQGTLKTTIIETNVIDFLPCGWYPGCGG